MQSRSMTSDSAIQIHDGEAYEPDPVFLSSLREARWILAMWLGCFVWTLAASLAMGYPDTVDPETSRALSSSTYVAGVNLKF